MTRVECFDRLFNKHYVGLLAFVDSYLHNSEEAADIVQAAFVKLWERGEFSRDEHSLKSFLYTTSKNLTLDYLKHQKIRQIFSDSTYKSYQATEQELIMEALRDFNAFEKEEGNTAVNVKKLVMKLPLSDRHIFILSKYNNLTNQEIADILGISVKTVEKRLKISINFIKKRICIIIF